MTRVVDVIVRSMESRTTFLATHDPELTGEGLFVGRVVRGRSALDVDLAVAPEEVALLRWEEEPARHETQIRLFSEEDPEAVRNRFLVQRASGPDWEAWTGFYRDDHVPFQVTALSDPEPTLIIAGIAAAACLIKLGLDALRKGCEQQFADLARQCIDQGGSPKYRIQSTFGVKPKPFAIGCTRSCEFEGCTFAS